MEGAVIARIELRRRDLRFPLPPDFEQRLAGSRVEALDRRGKYLIAHLSKGESLIAHLGMSGRFAIKASPWGDRGAIAPAHGAAEKHDHVIFDLDGARPVRITFNDPRRFGFMDIVSTDALETCRHFNGMGPDPLSGAFSPDRLAAALKGKRTSIKAALLDQRTVAGLGNIYVCESLFGARLSPRRRAGSVTGLRSARLYGSLMDVLGRAIEAGGSSLRDFANAEGDLGYFQHQFCVYGRENENCPRCAAPIRRIVQGGRSSFFCSRCQR